MLVLLQFVFVLVFIDMDIGAGATLFREFCGESKLARSFSALAIDDGHMFYVQY